MKNTKEGRIIIYIKETENTKQCKYDKTNLIEIFNKILDLQVENIKHDNIVKLESILEYQFWMHSIKIELKNGKEINAFLNLIEKDKIKQSVYCYWNIFVNEINKKEKNKNNMNNIKVSISEESKDEYKNILFLKLESQQNELNNYKTKIYLIDIQKYMKENNHLNINNLKFEKEKLLFVGLTL